LGAGRGAKQLQRPLGSQFAEQERELIRKKAPTLKLLVWDEESELCTLSRCNKRLEKKRQWNGVGDVEGFKNRGSTYRGSSNLKLIITALVLFLETFSGVWGTKLQERAGESMLQKDIYTIARGGSIAVRTSTFLVQLTFSFRTALVAQLTSWSGKVSAGVAELLLSQFQEQWARLPVSDYIF
jgi:hypothetical protein